MDTIVVNEGSDQIQIVEASDGVPVSITEENISVDEFGDSYGITVKEDSIEIKDADDSVTLTDEPESIPIQYQDVLIVKTINPEDGELEVPYSQQVDFEGNDIIYKGWAATGSVTSDAVWRIQRITFVGTDDDVVMVWANGDGNFDNIWDDHLTLPYS